MRTRNLPRFRVGAAAGGLLLAATTGCTSTSADPDAKPTATETVTVTASPSEPAWPIGQNTGGTGPGPQFPQALDGWRRRQEWNIIPRAFDHTWTDASGPDYDDFPSTMNGCDTTLFLIRWRAVADGAQVVAGWSASGHLAENLMPASAGWMVLDGCQTPRWRLKDAPNGGTLTDVTVDVQEWAPAP